MNYRLRLDSKGIYISDIQTIINSIKLNGNKVTCDSINVSHPNGAEITLLMNFGLETNSKNPPIIASLNILGFKTKNNQEFIFNIVPFPCEETTIKAEKLSVNGTYKSLGFGMKLPVITDKNLFESINILNNVKNSKDIGQAEYDSIARLIITLSEATRFSSVANGINSVLGNENSFSPNLFEIIGWGGHSLAS
jgi:hypothetical protein